MTRPDPGALPPWASRYVPLPGVPDEMVDASGAPRPHWRRFLEQLGAQDIERSIATADRHIRDMGISYRVHGEAGERSWPLSRLPLILDQAEWSGIAAGVAQRAELLEQILADVYGEGRLVAEGALPAAAITGSRDYLRPMAGVSPPGGRWIRLYAADLGRGPDGRWWVLGDRTQAPSGAGYALENRMVLSRAFPALYGGLNVERLAPFFRAFRDGIAHAAERAQPRICLLTPGPWSETYFEQAYLARYLGFLLVEGDDLVVHAGKAHVRTIAGLRRADVIWRRVDSDFIDPLELASHSRLGAPGLMDAIRAGSVVVANMPGSALLEARALMAFLPRLAQRVLGQDLLLPNVATWWCGQDDARRDVLSRLGDFAIAGAFSDTLPGLGGQPHVLAGELDPEARGRLASAIAERGVDHVAQEVVRLSTAPVWNDGRLEARPFVLRVFAAATEEGWTVMPGGFCRISDQPDARAVSMGGGVQSADVWVLSDQPVSSESLLPAAGDAPIRRLLGNLPSRAADNLFWYGRYLERCEATLRVLRALCARTMEKDLGSGGLADTLAKLKELLVSWAALPRPKTQVDMLTFVGGALLSPSDPGSALSLVRMAKNAASIIRERLSADAWQLLRELETEANGRLPESEAEAFEAADRMLRILAALSGLAQENTNRVAGWRFLDMGRRVERGINACRFARLLASDVASADDLDVLLDLIDSQITYRSRYLAGVGLAPVRDMALLDPFNPRSLAFQVETLAAHIAQLPTLAEDGLIEEPRRLISLLEADVKTAAAHKLTTEGIAAYERDLMTFADALAARYFLQRPGAAAQS